MPSARDSASAARPPAERRTRRSDNTATDVEHRGAFFAQRPGEPRAVMIAGRETPHPPRQSRSRAAASQLAKPEHPALAISAISDLVEADVRELGLVLASKQEQPRLSTGRTFAPPRALARLSQSEECHHSGPGPALRSYCPSVQVQKPVEAAY